MTAPYQVPAAPFPGDSALLMGVLVADAINYHGHDLSGHMRKLSDDDLRVLAIHTAECEGPALALTNAIEAEYGAPLTTATWWVTDVLPAISKEADRRNRPPRAYNGNSPVTRLKALDLEQVAARYTTLRPAGKGKSQGCCPIHKEKTPSFYIYEDSQRWKCFGACGRGGDVIDLLRALNAKGAL